ncbi:holin [Ectobacillus sp. JY-23]|uniref:holin n=1 Tax=Ectobacillus sp. JY-23 TaxID=2933872 RepID=UPI001FF20A07|nr:holin [Ectobacillus sp. JY-23]UOY92908.1 holin [Ectobacillus sp. JY-23]
MFEQMVLYLIAVIIGLSQVVKGLGLQAKYIPLLNVALGVLLGVFFLPAGVQENILGGIVVGLSASGLFDQSKIIKK